MIPKTGFKAVPKKKKCLAVHRNPFPPGPPASTSQVSSASRCSGVRQRSPQFRAVRAWRARVGPGDVGGSFWGGGLSFFLSKLATPIEKGSLHYEEFEHLSKVAKRHPGRTGPGGEGRRGEKLEAAWERNQF